MLWSFLDVTWPHLHRGENLPHPLMTQHIRDRLHKTFNKLSTRWGSDPSLTSPYAKKQDWSIFSIPTKINYQSLFWTKFWLKLHRTGTSPTICLTNQLTGPYMTRVSNGNYLRGYFSVEVKIPQRHLNIKKNALSSNPPQGQIKFSIDDKDTERLPQTKT